MKGEVLEINAIQNSSKPAEVLDLSLSWSLSSCSLEGWWELLTLSSMQSSVREDSSVVS